MLAEPNFLSRDERERLCQLMFEVGLLRWRATLYMLRSWRSRWTAGCRRLVAWPLRACPRARRWVWMHACIAIALLPPLPLQVFNVAGYYGADQAVCSVYALGRLGGTVVDIGYDKIGAPPLVGRGWLWAVPGRRWCPQRSADALGCLGRACWQAARPHTTAQATVAPALCHPRRIAAARPCTATPSPLLQTLCQ